MNVSGLALQGHDVIALKSRQVASDVSKSVRGV